MPLSSRLLLMAVLALAISGCQQTAPRGPLVKYGLKSALETNVWTHHRLTPHAERPSGGPMLMPEPQPDLYDRPAGEVNVFLVHWGEDLFPCGLDDPAVVSYSDGDTERMKCVPHTLAAARQKKWTGTAIFNGARFRKDASACTANPNVPHKAMAAYLDDVSYIDIADTVSLRARTRYTAPGEHDARLWYTPIRANRKFMQFWESAVTIDMEDTGSAAAEIASDAATAYPTSVTPSCNNNNRCTANTTVHLTVPDGDGNALDPAFISGKKAFVLLKGFELDHDGNRRQFNAARVAVRLSDDAVSEAGTLPLTVSVKYKGQLTPKAINAKVHFTVGVYDPDNVAYVSMDSSRSATWNANGNERSARESQSINLPWDSRPKGDFECAFAGV